MNNNASGIKTKMIFYAKQQGGGGWGQLQYLIPVGCRVKSVLS